MDPLSSQKKQCSFSHMPSWLAKFHFKKDVFCFVLSLFVLILGNLFPASLRLNKHPKGTFIKQCLQLKRTHGFVGLALSERNSCLSHRLQG